MNTDDSDDTDSFLPFIPNNGLNLADAQTILGLMAKDEYKTNADVNNDSSVDLADYQTVLGIMAKQ